MDSWIAQVFSHPTWLGTLIIIAKTVVVYLFLVVGLRLMGKRQLGQMNLYDLILIIVLANAVQNAMVGDDTTLVGGIVAAVTLLVVNRIFALLITRSKRMERTFVGDPLLIVNHGKLVKKHMEAEGVTVEQVMAALREHGMEDIKAVQIAVLEVDGTISVVPSGGNVHRTRRHYKGLRLP